MDRVTATRFAFCLFVPALTVPAVNAASLYQAAPEGSALTDIVGGGPMLSATVVACSTTACLL